MDRYLNLVGNPLFRPENATAPETFDPLNTYIIHELYPRTHTAHRTPAGLPIVFTVRPTHLFYRLRLS